MLRFAPSPTGDIDISDLRVAILNYLVSQQKDEQFLIRIEDTNKKLNIEGKDTEIMMILEKFALKHNSVFHQSEHKNLYQTLALQLLKEKKAFVCKCTNEESEIDLCSGGCEDLKPEEYRRLKESKEKFVIRLKKPNADISYDDVIKGSITTTADEIDSFVIVQTDGTPTYNFACAADDMMSNISYIIRDEKHLSNTARQIHIKNLLSYDNETTYAHIPTVLSDSEEEIPSVKSLFEQGFIPDAILNYLLLLGNEKTPKEIFTLPDAIEWFDLEKISTSEVKFEMDKLHFINREHIKMLDDRKLSTIFGFADVEIGKLAKLYLEECSTTNELQEKIHTIFSPKEFSGELEKEMTIMSKIIANAPYFETFDELEKYLLTQSGLLKEENFSKALRYLLTGAGDGPELSKIYPFIKSYILEVAS